MFPNRSRHERVVIAGQNKCRHAEADARVDDALNVSSIDGIILKHISGNENGVDAMFFYDCRKGFRRLDALSTHLRTTRTNVPSGHADLPIGSMEDFHPRLPLRKIPVMQTFTPQGSHASATDAWHSLRKTFGEESEKTCATRLSGHRLMVSA